MPRDTSLPSFLIPQDGVQIHLSITGSDALLEEQGYTYNQVGFTYNQVGVAYGGVYNQTEDIIPLSLSFSEGQVSPLSLVFSDIYTNNILPPPNSYQSTAPGFFMFVTHQ